MRGLGALGAALVALVAAPRLARAQDEGGYALDHFELTPAGDVFWGVPSPFASGHVAPRGYLAFDYEHRPIRVVLRDAAGNPVGGELAVVSGQGSLHADFSLAFFDRLLVSLHLPVAVLDRGDDPGTPGVSYTALSAPRAGDLRIGARGRLFGDEASPFQLGVDGLLFAPTGSREQYFGEGVVRGVFDLSLGGRVGGKSAAFVYTASGGVELRASERGHAARYGVGVGLLALEDVLQLDAELVGVSAFRPSAGVPLSTEPVTVADTTAGTNLELAFGAKVRVLGGLTFGAAAGPGLLSAVGTPIFRALGMVGWAPLAEPVDEEPGPVAPKDGDDDGIPDDSDACPKVAGQPNTDPMLDGCPPADRDADLILDVDDACPATAGERSTDATKNGCPPDGDGDGVADATDACPAAPGDPSDDPAKNGCPVDGDGDGIVDRKDACPAQAGPESTNPKWHGCPPDGDGDGILLAQDACPADKGSASKDPTKNGCPKLTAVTEGEILARQQVQFVPWGHTLRDTLSPKSDALLGEVRDALQSHPEIELVEVQGHTDDTGEATYNRWLSQQRALAVRDWLVRHGVKPERLQAQGYGPDRPIADNRVRTGRDQNRRVQFVILRRR
ncbi:MAG: OmpA family protein [Polyangiaceae bacterium]|nr:OmpA family protein [Polyangiaceae bacterium]